MEKQVKTEDKTMNHEDRAARNHDIMASLKTQIIEPTCEINGQTVPCQHVAPGGVKVRKTIHVSGRAAGRHVARWVIQRTAEVLEFKAKMPVERFVEDFNANHAEHAEPIAQVKIPDVVIDHETCDAMAHDVEDQKLDLLEWLVDAVPAGIAKTQAAVLEFLKNNPRPKASLTDHGVLDDWRDRLDFMTKRHLVRMFHLSVPCDDVAIHAAGFRGWIVSSCHAGQQERLFVMESHAAMGEVLLSAIDAGRPMVNVSWAGAASLLNSDDVTDIMKCD